MNSDQEQTRTFGHASRRRMASGRHFRLRPPVVRGAVFAISFGLAMSAQTLAQICGTPPCGGGGGGGPPIGIIATQDLAFGTLAPDIALPGTATIEPATGTKSVGGGVFDFGGFHSPAAFAVTGKKNTPVFVTLPGAVTLTSGANSMTLNSFTWSPGVVVLDNNGNANVSVGATLQVGANQPAGTYTGIFDFTVNY